MNLPFSVSWLIHVLMVWNVKILNSDGGVVNVQMVMRVQEQKVMT